MGKGKDTLRSLGMPRNMTTGAQPTRTRSLLLVLWIYAAPLVAPWAILFGTNATDATLPLVRTSLPQEPRREDRCTWACHNRGCRHPPRLPAVLTGDRYLFGQTIRGLYAVGRVFSSDRALGYGAANLVVFCALWPGLMYALWVIFWRQFFEIRALRALQEPP